MISVKIKKTVLDRSSLQILVVVRAAEGWVIVVDDMVDRE